MKKKITQKDPILKDSLANESFGELFGRVLGDREERTEKIELLKGMLQDAIEYLDKAGASEGAQYRKDLENEFNLDSYFSELLDVMDGINLNKENIKSNVSQKNDPKYDDKLPLFGAILIAKKVPPLINTLDESGRDDFQVGEVCELMDDYAELMLAYVTLFGISGLREMTAKMVNRDHNLAIGRLKGAQKQHEDADERNGKWRQMGKEFMRANPGCGVTDAVNHIYTQYAEGCKKSTVETALKGIKAELKNESHKPK